MDTVIHRDVQTRLLSRIKSGKVLLLMGARRTGKSVLLRHIMSDMNLAYLYLDGEDMEVDRLLADRTIANYKQILANKNLLIIDEAQKIPEIGLKLKLMIDHIPDLTIIATGSSAFDLGKETGEPLTGRKHTFKLFPFSEQELGKIESITERRNGLHNRLVYGNYPELIHLKSHEEKTEYISELADSYLLKDILSIDGIRNSNKMFDLLRLIAFQVGSEVSLQELGMQLGMSKNTVESYLDLLSKVFIIYNVRGFSRNLRKEVTKMSKWYFVDNGLRNYFVSNFSPISNRQDIGILWENYILGERLKHQARNGNVVFNYFWRTYDGQEIDWIEERDGQLFGYELKWSSKKKTKTPGAWKKNYPDAEFCSINQDNYWDWIND